MNYTANEDLFIGTVKWTLKMMYNRQLDCFIEIHCPGILAAHRHARKISPMIARLVFHYVLLGGWICLQQRCLALTPPAPRSTEPINTRGKGFKELSRATLLQFLWVTTISATVVNAFEGGVGGLGKTKPVTGVTLFDETSAPLNNDKGIVSAEIQSTSGKKPILVEFQTPWPLLPTTSGLEARDLRSSESAFVQVVSVTPNWQDRKVFQEILMNSVLASQGKFGAYGSPTDLRVKPYNTETGIFVVTFTSYTPAMRESERQVWIKPTQVDATLIMLIVGTTRNAFASQEKTFSKIMESFLAVAAPETSLRTN